MNSDNDINTVSFRFGFDYCIFFEKLFSWKQRHRFEVWHTWSGRFHNTPWILWGYKQMIHIQSCKMIPLKRGQRNSFIRIEGKLIFIWKSDFYKSRVLTKIYGTNDLNAGAGMEVSTVASASHNCLSTLSMSPLILATINSNLKLQQ